MNVLDLGSDLDPTACRPPEERRLWSLLLLQAIRDGAVALLLRTVGEDVQLFMSVESTWIPLVPPPIGLTGPMRALVWSLGRAEGRRGPVLSLFRKADRPEAISDAMPWESTFRVRLGDGSKEVFARAEAIPGGVDLTLTLGDITISPFAADAELKRVFPRWREDSIGTGG